MHLPRSGSLPRATWRNGAGRVLVTTDSVFVPFRSSSATRTCTYLCFPSFAWDPLEGYLGQPQPKSFGLVMGEWVIERLGIRKQWGGEYVTLARLGHWTAIMSDRNKGEHAPHPCIL